MNVLYCCCIHEPWLDVAMNLKELGYVPSYWIGWPEGEQQVKKALPETIYHDINQAWKGVFPKEVDFDNKTELDGFLLSDYGYEELLGLKMMDRLDWNRESFSFMERQSFFRNLLDKWLILLKEYEINLVIFPSIPHRVFDYALYLGCKILSIPFLSFKKTRWRGEILPLISTIEEIPDLTRLDVNQKVARVEEYIQRQLRQDYSSDEPHYIKNQKKDAQKSTAKKLFEKTIDKPQKVLQLFETVPSYWKEKGKLPKESSFSRFQFILNKQKGKSYKQKLKNYYDQLTVAPDLDEEYILVALHYQPEVTSVPSGNIFGDQILMIKSLLKHTSEKVNLYVKEHKSQFMPLLEGETSRIKNFYDELNSYTRVKLIPSDGDTFREIDNSLGVATLIGNVGVEALIRGKPVVLYGNAWYQYVEGVLKVDSVAKQKEIEAHLRMKEPDLQVVSRQFHNIVSQGISANHYKNVAAYSGISNEESIKNLTHCILKAFPL